MKQKNFFSLINSILLAVLVLSLVVNQAVIIKINNALGVKSYFKGITKSGGKATASNIKLDGDITNDAIKLAISDGVPEIYGEELGISFGEAQLAINAMKLYDPTYGKQKITLTGDNLQRYIDVAIKISCEYCCSAKSIISQDGKGACGCAHSQAMRGLLAYLIQNHGDKYSNDEMLRELARWKAIYFPKQTIKKMTEQLQSGNYTPDTSALLLGVDLPDYGGDGKAVPLPSEIENLPGMVGGC